MIRHWIRTPLGTVIFDGERATLGRSSRDVTAEIDLDAARAEYAQKVRLDLCTVDDERAFEEAMRRRRRSA